MSSVYDNVAPLSERDAAARGVYLACDAIADATVTVWRCYGATGKTPMGKACVKLQALADFQCYIADAIAPDLEPPELTHRAPLYGERTPQDGPRRPHPLPHRLTSDEHREQAERLFGARLYLLSALEQVGKHDARTLLAGLLTNLERLRCAFDAAELQEHGTARYYASECAANQATAAAGVV